MRATGDILDLPTAKSPQTSLIRLGSLYAATMVIQALGALPKYEIEDILAH